MMSKTKAYAAMMQQQRHFVETMTKTSAGAGRIDEDLYPPLVPKDLEW